MELKYQVSIIAKNISISTQQIEKCRFGKYVFHLVHEATSLKKKRKEKKRRSSWEQNWPSLTIKEKLKNCENQLQSLLVPGVKSRPWFSFLSLSLARIAVGRGVDNTTTHQGLDPTKPQTS